jgi:hypothetical protein
VSIDIPPITPDYFPTMTTVDDSVSTFYPKAIIEELNILSDPTTTYTKKATAQPIGILKAPSSV